MHFASHASEAPVQQSPAGMHNQFANPQSSSPYTAQAPVQAAPQAGYANPNQNASVSLTGVASQDIAPGFDGLLSCHTTEKIGMVAGNEQFSVKHRGRIYHCISEDARTEFLRDPDHYSPVLSGYDIVHFMERVSWSRGNARMDVGFRTVYSCSNRRRTELSLTSTHCSTLAK